ncbi:MAG TPA: phospholipid carrier-dependent glycosyltransferase [Casimicrobiaceae bacterium]|nr:phospholipid carrier-dependent glycosyltransferase [Casimicrobiaceae bacterium]
MLASLPRYAWVLIIAVASVAWFSGLDLRRLHHPDEGRYAEIAREMSVSGDWLTPRLNGIRYFEKPPLQYWVTAASFRAFETDEWTARLAPAVAGFATIFVVGFAAAALAGPAAGVYAALALAGCVWHIALAHIVTLDALLSFLLACALATFLLAQRDGLSRRALHAWMLAAWALIALAALTKGLVALAIPAMALVAYSLLTRDWGPWRRLKPATGLAVFLAIAAPWFVMVAMANPGFADFFFVNEHIRRFATEEAKRPGPWWYFVPLFAVGLLPWLSIAPWTWRDAWRARAAPNGFRWQAFCLAWAGVVFAFFSVSQSKLPSYILPMFPALMLALGPALEAMPSLRIARLMRPLAVTTTVLGVLVIAGFESVAPRFADGRTPVETLVAYAPWAKTGAALLAAAAVAGWWWLRRGDERSRTLGIATVALGSLVAFQVLIVGLDTFRETRSGYDILREAQNAPGAPFDRRAPFYQVGSYDQTLPFYLGRTTTLVAYRDEFATGLDMEPDLAIPTMAQWIDLWKARSDGYALIPLADYRQLEAQRLPMRVLARGPRRVLVSRN